MGLAAELAAYVGDRQSAEEIYPLLESSAQLNLCEAAQYPSFGPVSHFPGILAAVLEQRERALEHFEIALDLIGRMQARTHLTGTQLEMVRVLRICGDSRRARKLQQTATASTRELGMAALQV